MKRIAILGSNSFSGATCAAVCLEQGIEVLGASRSPEPARCFLPYRWGAAASAGFRFVQADLNRDLDALLEALDAFRPEVVVNFAAQSMVGQSWAAPLDWYRTNVMGLVALEEALRRRDYLRAFVQASTPEVYGSTTGVVTEAAPFNPTTPYAASKAAGDFSLLTIHKAYDFPVRFTRAANVCGPGQQLYRIIPRAIYCIRAGEKLNLEGGGTAVRAFVHMRDVAAGTLLAATVGRPGAAYHLSTDERVSIRELVTRICAALEVRLEDHVTVAPARLGQDDAYLLDSTRARTELGWQPRYRLDDIIAETVAWMHDQWDEIRRQPTAYRHQP
ncbi:MAG: GDP-mannose 4,6-dehydratase [Candidatus Marinimicrobia bacterium]|nr:GDP-mannose 4,6-dehydratase [Candidatus Neomarinimicrobiota bacterium]